MLVGSDTLDEEGRLFRGYVGCGFGRGRDAGKAGREGCVEGVSGKMRMSGIWIGNSVDLLWPRHGHHMGISAHPI